MRRTGTLRRMALAAALFWPFAAAAQTVDDRYPALELRPSVFPWSMFAGSPPQHTMPANVPMPRPVGRARRPAIQTAAKADAGSRARQEELLATSYNAAPTALAAGDPGFVSWLPRLFAPAAPATPPPEAAAPAQPRVLPAAPPPALSEREIPVFNIRSRPYPRDLGALIAAKAHKHGVPIAWAHAFVTVESNYDPTVVGRGATLGLMQIKHPTAQGMGFTGTAEELMDPATNLEWGMRYLGGARRLAKGDVCGTVLRYQAGHRAVEMTPAAAIYCAKIKSILAGQPSSSRVAEIAPPR